MKGKKAIFGSVGLMMKKKTNLSEISAVLTQQPGENKVHGLYQKIHPLGSYLLDFYIYKSSIVQFDGIAFLQRHFQD